MDDRKAAILQAVVEAYIETAQPVGSGVIARDPKIDVSAATIRNEMAALEREGYLAQPHTSAGRIPTDAGYRFFVDQIGSTGPRRLSDVDARRVRIFFDHARGEIEQRLGATSRLLADMTDYAAVVVGPSHDPARIRSVELVELVAGHLLVVAVLSDGAIVKQHLTVDDPGAERIAAAAQSLRESLVGSPLTDLPAIRPSRDPAVDALAAVARDAVAVPLAGAVYVGGASRMAGQFDAIETVRRVLAILEEQLLVVTLLSDLVNRGLSVAIGAETGLEPLNECSVVVAPYQVEGEEAGTIGLLGPTRMDYPKALATVAVVSRRLGRSLEAGA
jgi:heat-inducible transcriptional repressor